MSWITKISTKMLMSRKRRGILSPVSVIAICGIAFGMAATLVSLSVISGFQKAYEEAILGFNAHIVLVHEGEMRGVGEGEISRLRQELRRAKGRVGEEEGVVAMTPFIFREGLGVLPDEVTGVVLKGVDPETMQSVYPLKYQTIQETGVNLAELLSQGDDQIPPVIVGKALYDRFFPSGDKETQIKVLIPKGDIKREKPRLKDYAQTFKVVGTFESGLYEFDSQFIITSLSVMRELFKLRGGATGIEMRLDDPAKAPTLARLIEEKLPPGFQAVSWDELNESLFAAMKMEKNLFIIIMLLIILIASFNVMGSILMLILNRQSDIAILMAMGANRRGLNRAFALQGFFLGFVGVVVGMIISFVLLFTLKRYEWFSLDPQIYFISQLPVEWPFWLWSILAVVTLVICYFISQLASRMVIRYGSLVQTFR